MEEISVALGEPVQTGNQLNEFAPIERGNRFFYIGPGRAACLRLSHYARFGPRSGYVVALAVPWFLDIRFSARALSAGLDSGQL